MPSAGVWKISTLVVQCAKIWNPSKNFECRERGWPDNAESSGPRLALQL